MTFWWSEDNYGQLLQCYALQKYLRDKGHDAYLIRYDPRNDYIPTPLPLKLLKACNPVKLINYLNNKIRTKKSVLEQKQNSRHFEEFRNKYIKQSDKIYHSYKELKENPPEADMYIVGSDQVWNFFNLKLKKCKNLLHAYFLDFGNNKTKKIAYAASWGTESVEKDFLQEIKPLISKFSYVSVRERSGINLTKECGFSNPEWVVDPTLLLHKEIYLNLISENVLKQDKKKKYIFLYMLKNKCYFNTSTIYNWANKNNLEVIYVTGNGIIDNYKKTYATIPEWLHFIQNAEYVVTNSFHCSLFSIIFNKQFGVIPLATTHKTMNTRIISLFEQFGLENRFIKNNNFDILNVKYQLKNIKIKFPSQLLEI